jgi:ankyrin repeat protein
MDAARRASELGVALVLASERNMIIDMCGLLSQGADVNYVAVRVLMSRGADVNYVHRYMHEGKEISTTPLIQAAVNGHADAVRVLMSRGADVNYVHRYMHEGKEISTTPLIQAAVNGHADAVRMLMSRGAEVNKHEPCNGSTALHVAVQEVHVPVIELLISKGAIVDVRRKDGKTPLHMVGTQGSSHLPS